jgi:hypothetical protein
MGSTTVSIRVTEKDLPPATNPGRSGSLYGNYFLAGNDKHRRIVSAAVDLWRQGDYDRNGNPYAGNPIMLEPKAIEMLNDFESYPTKSRDDSPIVPLIDKRDYEVKTKTITVKLDDAEWKEYIGGQKWGFLEKKVAQLLPELAGKISNAKLDTGDVKYYNDVTPYWNVRSTVEADTSGGKAKTIYTLLVNGSAHRSPKEEFPTQAAARAAGVKLFNENTAVTTVDVQAKVVREDNTSLVKLTRKVSSASAKVIVEYIKLKTETPRTDGWMVAFSYHT